MKWELVKKRGKMLIRITVGGKSRPIKRAEKRMQKRAIEMRRHFHRRVLEVENHG